ncbi:MULTISPECIES: response regulator receiver domain [unclassified Pseudomonas]|uniref:response regulator receiver domain n=1 Tax=unclassified Pseudomonas TaxID=196821 RepID=UPI00117A3D81|nr:MULTISPECIES: response regulator receiver domain [unclassified Pseudomonas]
MHEANIEVDNKYGDLIEEVFIKPIRTVMVVDDEFPTVDALLQKELGGVGNWVSTNVERACKIIQSCRADTRRWVVDIHDGQNSFAIEGEGEGASHFHHSDLMILDYHLDRDQPEDGGNAVSILRRLADNDHFNLVIVYTKGYGLAGGQISRVVNEIAIGLSSFDTRLAQHERASAQVRELLEGWEDSNQGVADRILSFIDDNLYLKIKSIKDSKIDWVEVGEWPELEAFKEFVRNGPPEAVDKFCGILKFSVSCKQESLKCKLAQKDFGKLDWDFEGVTGVNWIRTDRLFVTVVSKSEDPATLPSKLLSSLVRWNPEPHRLLMSKMRAELDERGVLAEGTVLDNQYLQAGWLQEYLTEDVYERQWKVHSTISRHWEGLGDSIRLGVTGFADRLAEYLIAEGRAEVVKQWYPRLSEQDVKSYLNSYVSSKVGVEGAYLTTGHVIRLDKCTGDGCFWLCLSPACDLVPGQKSSGWPKRLGDHTPFIAVELFPVKESDALKNAFAGNHLFLKVESKILCFSFTPPLSIKEDPLGEKISNPKWEQMFAGDQGRFSPGTQNITITRADGGNGELAFKKQSAQVVSHLRYEYALNLLNRLGSNLSRVGLDFIGYSGAVIPISQTELSSGVVNQPSANQPE